MSHSIDILQNAIDKHQEAIINIKINSEDPEMYSDVLFCEEEIYNHKLCIKDLKQSILELIKKRGS